MLHKVESAAGVVERQQEEPSSISQITVRQVNFEFPEHIERYWLGNSPFKTHLFNSLHLFLPDIELWIIRNIKRNRQIKEPRLKQEVRAFIQQEAQHSSAHAKFWDKLRQQGYEFEQFLSCERKIIYWLEKFDLKLNLAAIAGFEHLTTLVAEIALENQILAQAEPNMRAIFEWHAQEEIEHRSVAFDVFKNATDSYLIRVAGLIIGHFMVILLLNWGIFILLLQDRKLWNRLVVQEMLQFWFFKDKVFFKAVINCFKYLRKDFHPSQKKFILLEFLDFEQVA